jgi:hypothetical protein
MFYLKHDNLLTTSLSIECCQKKTFFLSDKISSSARQQADNFRKKIHSLAESIMRNRKFLKRGCMLIFEKEKEKS